MERSAHLLIKCWGLNNSIATTSWQPGRSAQPWTRCWSVSPRVKIGNKGGPVRDQQISDEVAAWGCAVLLMGGDWPVELDMAALASPWSEIIPAVARADGEGRRAAFEEMVAGLPNAGELTSLVYGADPDTSPPPDHPGPESQELADCPPLPEEAQLDPDLGIGAGGWLDLYVDYAAAISPMTPLSFHTAAGLWLVSVAVARRLKVPMAFEDVYPNLFVMWVAFTTLYRKSTGLGVARRLAWQVFPHLLAAQDTTPEAFLSDLAGREPTQFDALSEEDQTEWRRGRDFAAQKGWLLDEMSGLLASAGRDYNAGLVEAMLRFYDCSPQYIRSTRRQGRVVVRNAYLSLLGASTPAALSPHLLSERLWSMGWWPRFAILTPEVDRPQWREPQERPETAELTAGLRQLHNQLPAAIWPTPPEALTVFLGTGVHDAWRRYNQALSLDLLTDDLDHRLWGTYGRLPVQCLKVATLLAALDWEPNSASRIELPHLARALTICEEWRASAHRVLAIVAATEFEQLRVRILYQIGRLESTGATLRDLSRAMRDKTPNEIEHALLQMVKAGEVEPVRQESGRQGGRPTTRYRLASE